MMMNTQRMTITLPNRVAEKVRQDAKKKRRAVSRVILDALIQQEEGEIRQRMIEGYKATRDEGRRLAEEWLPLGFEALPDN